MKNGVTTAEHCLAIADRGRTIDVIAAFISPNGFAGGDVNAVQLEIVTADENAGLIVQLYRIGRAKDFIAGFIFPNVRAGGGVEGIKEIVGRTYEEFAIEEE